MRFTSAWRRGMFFGFIFGAAMAMFPALGCALGNAPFAEVAFAGGVVVLIWGTLGFLAGLASHSEQRADTPKEPLSVALPSLTRQLCIDLSLVSCSVTFQ